MGELTEGRSEIRDGMRIDWDVPIPMPDGVVLRGDLFRPVDQGVCPVLLSYGPYGKNVPFQEGYPMQWDIMVSTYPDTAQGSTNNWQAWELADPEKWVPHGYALLRVDSRGAGRSPGVIDCFSDQEVDDLYECIEWAGVQPWSNGKVGLAGISYYAINQWNAAARNPPHLAAICPWEGASDFYREAVAHGGIPCDFLGVWFPVQVMSVQHGLGENGTRNPHTGMLASGDETLGSEVLAARRGDLRQDIYDHQMLDDYWRARSVDPTDVKVPLLSAANWGGVGLHLRGNIEGYLAAASEHKYLEIHGGAHWAVFYTDYAVELQRRFFDRFLKDGPEFDQPPVLLHVRHPGERFVPRAEHEWPLARTDWVTTYLDVANLALTPDATEPAAVAYEALGDGMTLLTPAFEEETEITGPVAAKLWISSDTADADIFLVVRLFDPAGDEVLFVGASEPRQPITQGWLRASHRALDDERTLPWRPFHPHTKSEPLVPGEVYELDVEIWPTCIVVPVGYRLGLSVLGRDYEHGFPGIPTPYGPEMRGSSLHVHQDPVTRPPELFDNTVTVYSGGDRPSHVVLPVIPSGE